MVHLLAALFVLLFGILTVGVKEVKSALDNKTNGRCWLAILIPAIVLYASLMSIEATPAQLPTPV